MMAIALLAFCAPLANATENVPIEDIPDAVLQAAKEAFQGAEVVKCEKDGDGDDAFYVVKFEDNEREGSVMLTSDASVNGIMMSSVVEDGETPFDPPPFLLNSSAHACHGGGCVQASDEDYFNEDFDEDCCDEDYFNEDFDEDCCDEDYDDEDFDEDCCDEDYDDEDFDEDCCDEADFDEDCNEEDCDADFGEDFVESSDIKV
jgi:hypothetical protein